MSEADAEDGLHGLDEPLAIKNDTRLNIEFAFFPTASSLEEARPSPISAHTILKKSPPRKRKSMERRNGARAERRVREALVGMISSSRKKFAHWL